MSDNCINALVSGVGAIIGQGIIRSLKSSKYKVNITGVDLKYSAIASKLCHSFFEKPECAECDHQYLKFWYDLLEKNAIDIVFFGIDQDIEFIRKNLSYFSGLSCKFVLNNVDLIEICNDKWVMHQKLVELGCSVIPTSLCKTWVELNISLGPPPFILKPRVGNGSRGIQKLESNLDVDYWTQKATYPFIIQKEVGSDDEEYSVAAFGLGNGESLPAIIFRRRLSVAGNTEFAEVVEDERISLAVKQYSQYFSPFGPTNYQFRKEGGEYLLLEINPRISSSSSLRTAFGYNEAEMAIDSVLFNKVPDLQKVQKGKGWRYCEDIVEL